MKNARNSEEAANLFTPDFAEEYLRNLKWPDGIPTCPHCKSKRIGTIATRGCHKCQDCGKQFSPRAGTIFENSRVPVSKWLIAAWALQQPGGITSRDLAASINVTQTTACGMI
ncbi:MAG: transposase, partial [Pirellulaceae bacterium]|nr:transposase [Pirellulaceae bacterium]